MVIIAVDYTDRTRRHRAVTDLCHISDQGARRTIGRRRDTADLLDRNSFAIGDLDLDLVGSTARPIKPVICCTNRLDEVTASSDCPT